MASSQASSCSHFYELLDAWEKRSQEIDAQMRLLSLDLRLIRIGSNTSEFLAKANENERSLGDFVIGAREIKKQLENEASIQRKKLPKNDLDKFNKVKTTFDIQSKKVEKITKEISEARKQFKETSNDTINKSKIKVKLINNDTLFVPEMKNSTEHDNRRRLTLKQIKINNDLLKNELLEEAKTLQRVESNLDGYRQRLHDLHETKPEQSPVVDDTTISSITFKRELDFPEVLYTSWEQQTQKIDQQVTLLSKKICQFGTKLDTPKFRDEIDAEELHLCNLVRDVKDITKQVGYEVSIHRQDLSKTDWDMITTVQTSLNAALKNAQDVTNEIAKARKRFSKINNNTLLHREIEVLTPDDISSYLRFQEEIEKESHLYVEPSNTEELESIKSTIEQYYKLVRDYRDIMFTQSTRINNTNSNVTKAIDYEKSGIQELIYKSIPERKRTKPSFRKFLCGF